MKYRLTYTASRYVGVYGNSDPWEKTYHDYTFEAESPEKADSDARDFLAKLGAGPTTQKYNRVSLVQIAREEVTVPVS